MPKYVDDPPHLLLWRIDDLAPIVLMLVVGILADRLSLFLLIGVLLVRFYSKYRESRPDGHALHALYWFGLLPITGRTTPNPFCRRWLP
ncbi:type IV conjugative transfer system protein TraL [uncultured Thiodictyon sp.]|uniref:type IV conjugative transfer system protein TraL n=1 Tax=uncultured Thiodictyon sp. TaxID=1846217 RepID=UPI0026000AED|nr:type IV conjugative transfer system protein TraL [uncultured Thiodictyon sp.]